MSSASRWLAVISGTALILALSMIMASHSECPAQRLLPFILARKSCRESSLATAREITLALEPSPFKSTSKEVSAYCFP